MRLIYVLLFSAAAAVAAPTQIRDTGYTSFGGVLFSGSLIINGPDMTTADGRTVHRWQQSYVISSGAVSIDLEPNDTATPAGTSYSVVYRPASGTPWSERWVVPTSASPLKINQVRVATAPSPSLIVQPQQIASGGAAPGQALLWNGARYAPGNVATSTAWGGITGNLGDQIDLGNALAGKASLGQVQVASMGAGSPSANCALGQAVYTDLATGNPYWCTGTNVWSLLPLNWNSLPGKPSTFAPSVHAVTHASNGSDPVTPASIGAEVPLSFSSPLQRTGNTIACPGCATLAGGAANAVAYWTGASSLGSSSKFSLDDTNNLFSQTTMSGSLVRLKEDVNQTGEPTKANFIDFVTGSFMGVVPSVGGIRWYDQSGNVIASIKPASLGSTQIQATGLTVAGTLTNTGSPLPGGITSSAQTNVTVCTGGYSGNTCGQSASHQYMVQWAVEDAGMCTGSCNNTVSLTINWTDARGKPQSFSVGPIPLNKDNAEVAGTHWGSFPIHKSEASSVTYSTTVSSTAGTGMYGVYISVFDPTVK
jgi:hypothetical protein